MMKISAGRPIKQGMETDSVDFAQLFPTLRGHSLTGYMALSIMTDNGLEEGTFLFKEGEIIALEYKYLAKEKIVTGEAALKLIMNACLGRGTFDVYELSEEEIIQTREDNRNTVLKYKPTNKELIELLPDSFTDITLEEKIAAAKTTAVDSATSGKVSREAVLKKYGISHPDERMVDNLLKDVVK